MLSFTETCQLKYQPREVYTKGHNAKYKTQKKNREQYSTLSGRATSGQKKSFFIMQR